MIPAPTIEQLLMLSFLFGFLVGVLATIAFVLTFFDKEKFERHETLQDPH